MAKYRKKPLEIEAFHYGQDPEPQWFVDAVEKNFVRRVDSAAFVPPIKIQTLEGIMTGNRGDWIIKGVEGEIYPCANSIFQVTYEKVES